MKNNKIPYQEAGRGAWLVHWAQVLGLRDGYLGWAEGPRDAPLGWAEVLQGERVVGDETEESH